jgi:hypothetical protein
MVTRTYLSNGWVPRKNSSQLILNPWTRTGQPKDSSTMVRRNHWRRFSLHKVASPRQSSENSSLTARSNEKPWDDMKDRTDEERWKDFRRIVLSGHVNNTTREKRRNFKKLFKAEFEGQDECALRCSSQCQRARWKTTHKKHETARTGFLLKDSSTDRDKPSSMSLLTRASTDRHWHCAFARTDQLPLAFCVTLVGASPQDGVCLDSDGRISMTLLHKACQHVASEQLPLLIVAWCSHAARLEDHHGYTAPQDACELGRTPLESVKLLVGACPVTLTEIVRKR